MVAVVIACHFCRTRRIRCTLASSDVVACAPGSYATLWLRSSLPPLNIRPLLRFACALVLRYAARCKTKNELAWF